MTDRENRLRVTVLQLSRVIAGLEDLHKTVLPKDPGMYVILSQGDIELIAQLCKELGDMLGVEFDKGFPPSQTSAAHAVVGPHPDVEVPPTPVAGKE